MYGLISCVLAVFLLMFLVGSDGRDCGAVKDPDKTIIACSHIIAKAEQSGDIATAYFNKSLAYHNRG